jgi:hypothetical protein
VTAPHLRFRNVDRRVVAATAGLLAAGTSALAPDALAAAYTAWLSTVTRAYDVDRPALAFTPRWACADHGMYAHWSAEIRLPADDPDVLTLLHETRHHLQWRGRGPTYADGVALSEDDARAWSQSLHHLASRALDPTATAG